MCSIQAAYSYYDLFWKNIMVLQSNQVKRTPQDFINELIIRILNPLIVSRLQWWIDYLNIEANGFIVQKPI